MLSSETMNNGQENGRGPLKRKYMQGFTLVELAVVLVIIGLLVGGVLKSQELIVNARIRNLIAQQDGIKATFFSFYDRFRAFPGDYAQATVNIPGISVNSGCGQPGNNGNGNGNGQIEVSTKEAVLAWEHLSKAGFFSQSYTCAAIESKTTTPMNPYNIYLQLIYDGNYGIQSGGSVRHNIKTGAQIPVSILSEVDRKIDDGSPYTGMFQFSAYQGNAAAAPTENGLATCTSGNTAAAIWNSTNGNINCGGASLL